MSGSILERLRSDFELAERNETAVGTELETKPDGQKAKIWQQHTISTHINNIMYYNKDIESVYLDEDEKMKVELESMRGDTMFSSFYEKLKSTQEFYVRNPNAELDLTPNVNCRDTIDVQFSGEEVFGKYLDLTTLHLQYCNIPHMLSKEALQDHDYIKYLDKFNSFLYIHENIKKSKAYAMYIHNLGEYCTGFMHRTQPLVSMEEFISEWRKEFESKWNSGHVDGWKFIHSTGIGVNPNSNAKQAGELLRLGMYNAAEELQVLGMNRLKEALVAMNLKCGGTIEERAARLWSVRGLKPEDIPKKLKVKVNEKTNSNTNSSASGNKDNSVAFKEVAWQEAYIVGLTGMLSEVVDATRKHAEKQQNRTMDEKEQERIEEEFGLLQDEKELEDEAEDEAPIYNPLNLPLGWDGKPIPYWMYKLHGLGVEYKCEICGDASYWGRKAFDKHFQEGVHAAGMRRLNIPNTKHFHDITTITDARALYSKISEHIEKDQFVTDRQEEFEDSEGNILNRRTYEDLARQGLL